MSQFTRLGGKRVRKHHTITEETAAHIQQFADMHGLNYSEATEHLVRLGLKDDRHGYAEFLGDVVGHEMRKHFDAYAKLTASAVLEAGAAKEAAKAIYWWILMQEHGFYIDELEEDQAPSLKEFEKKFMVDPETVEGDQVLQMYQRINDRSRNRAVTAVGNTINNFDELIEKITKNESL